jgi:transcriptional regulator with XRE-family HTH domain
VLYVEQHTGWAGTRGAVVKRYKILNLVEVRTSLLLTQDELARKSNVSTKTVSEIECKAKKTVVLRTLKKLQTAVRDSPTPLEWAEV